MKKYLREIVIMLLFAGIINGCKKDSATTPGTQIDYSEFLKNTEWVGVLDRNGYEYPPPCCLKFKSRNSITVYAPFFLNVDGIYITPDSLNGKINSIDSLPDGRTSIAVSFPYIKDQVIYITNREKLVCMDAGLNKITFQLELFPSKGFSVKGTTWRGSLMTGGQFAYPDLSSIRFLADKDVTVYYRNGQLVPASGTPGTPGELEVAYKQVGAMVFMSGYKENGITLMDYFGVLMPSGDKMMVHSGSREARLPNYIETAAPYGPIGVTPIIYKQ